MTKHHAQEAGTTAGAAWGADQGAHSTPGAERPANRRTAKWRVENWDWDWQFWNDKVITYRLDWNERPWKVCSPDRTVTRFPTWREAMDYVNREIRVYRQAARARFIEVRPGATPSTTDVRVVFRCPACMSKEA